MVRIRTKGSVAYPDKGKCYGSGQREVLRIRTKGSVADPDDFCPDLNKRSGSLRKNIFILNNKFLLS